MLTVNIEDGTGELKGRMIVFPTKYEGGARKKHITPVALVKASKKVKDQAPEDLEADDIFFYAEIHHAAPKGTESPWPLVLQALIEAYPDKALKVLQKTALFKEIYEV